MNSEGRSQGLAQGRSQKYVQNGTPDFYLLKQMAQFSLHKNHRIVYFIMFYYVAIVCESSRQHIFVKSRLNVSKSKSGLPRGLLSS